ncbi:MAG TPA: tetratricopeptide repeat protein [Pyrinomonadaceae bacterium]|nr:tetratricopeptide repeat protein [Pyrinomonadaceae bacterium]
MDHTRRIFLPQRRNGAKRCRVSGGLPLRRCAVAGEILALIIVALAFTYPHFSARAKNEEVSSLIDAALYTRHEFFGAQAIVPFPTAEARNRLADVQAKYPDNAQIYLKLSQLDEKLGNEELALQEMQSFVKHESDEFKALQTMAEFLHRRAQFGAEAESLERMLHLAPSEQRVEVFRRLMALAETHLLEKYLTPRFYEQTIIENPSAYEIVKEYQERLIDNADYDKALTLIRQNRNQFPEYSDELIEKEASLLEKMDRVKEAEEVYKKAFDPFWSSELSENFYDFLKSNDRFRAYGHELREAFRRNPADFDTAVRLLDYSKYAGDERPDVFVQLEKTRAARHINWTQDELITITRLLLAEGYGEAASRFLYTLYLQGEMKPGSKLRARVLYQLFEILADAGDQRLSLTRGDLKFYQDIATADPHPGMMGGILSLILSDTDPKYEFGVEEERAVSYFNRAAAYRIFTAYKQENPTSPELAQMYLDIVRLYTDDKNLETASETLAEFEQRYTDAPEFPEVALKLADAYIATKKFDAERALYVRILDYLGQHRAKDKPLIHREITDENEQTQALNALSEPTTVKPPVIAYPPISNPGVNYTTSTPNEGSYNTSSSYSDQLISADEDDSDGIDYETVLQRYVSSLAKDNRTRDILALYANEIKKYPDEQALYEQMLQWLGQTNLVDEQLRVYQEALRAFPSTTWRDRLARWYVRQQRTKEFEALSRDVIAKVDDAEAEKYLHEFIDSKGFDAQLYFALYSVAHQRFPHNLNFVNGLLKFHSEKKQWDKWRTLISEYYFESRECRDQFLAHLSSHNELRGYLARARATLNQSTDSQSLLPYKLFRADASAQLSNFEEAIDAYRELNRIYPNSPEFAERLINLTRSFGQHNRRFLEESAAISQSLADASPSVAAYRTRAGEVQAELGDYTKARAEWEQLIPLARGDEDTYLDTATIYWDYYQYDDALRTIHTLRKQQDDESLYAFQAGVILEDKHQLRAALNEYIRALDSTGYYDPDTYRARNRLVTLSKRRGVSDQIAAAFIQERKRNRDDSLVLDYADFLDHAKRWPEASRLLREMVARSNSPDSLRWARNLFDDHDEVAGQVAALQRLIATATARRFEISYRLLLADVYSQNNQPEQAAGVLRALVQKYPTNYGVLTESADFCWRLGRRSNSLAILQSGMQRGLGRFHYLFGRKLAARHVEMQNFSAAQAVLEQLNREDRLNTEVFHELAKVYVRNGNQQQLRTTFGATIEAIKKQELDVREIRFQVASLRKEMIDAFTLLKDYSSAIEQHIEIINRDPDDEEQIDAAISYVRRYGGGDTLVNYYGGVAREAYKNYRWNVVLARIYDAKGDFSNAARQYHMALDNQPEMTELYDSLADVYTRAKDYGSAIAALRKAQELSNDDPQYIKQLVTLLEKAGRHHEAEVERRKLPPEEIKKLSVSDQFAEAARLRGTNLKTAVENYRSAFNAFAADPFKNELKTSDIVGYVQTVRSEEGLDQIMLRLWDLRGRLVAEAGGTNATHAGKAKELLATFDGAITEGVGGVAAERATSDELAALFKFIKEQAAPSKDDGTLALMRGLSRRAGFGSIEEEVLLSFKERDYAARDWPSYQVRLRALIDFYDERGAYQTILSLLEAEHARDPHAVDFDFASVMATNARLLGDNARELKALREHYQMPVNAQLLTSQDPLIERYFEVLWTNGEGGRSELLSCAQNSTPHQLQLIGFLLRKEDKELVHAAIERSPLAAVWKYSRNAEASLALNEFDERSEQYFSSALNFRPIGELIKQTPDTKEQLVGDDWYQLAQQYGRWLYSAGQSEQKLKSRSFLPAMIENRPADMDEQARLGRWYLEQKDFSHAQEHLILAHDAQPDDKAIIAALGSAYFLSGDSRKANELWDEIIVKSDSVADHALYLETLVKHKLNEQARLRVTKFLTTTLQKDLDAEQDYDSTERKQQFATFGNLIKTLARSFSASDSSEAPLAPATEAKKARFFAQLCAAAPDNRFLPEFLLRNSIVSRREAGQFYQILIKRSAGMPSYERDYAYSGLINESFDDSTVEYALDQETEYHRSEPDNDKIKWQREYLDYLIEQRQIEPARQLIASIEAEIKWHYARPVWLCFASLRLDVRGGRVAEAMTELQRLVGIKIPNSSETLPPSIERLNQAVALLRDEGHSEEARSLLESAYARELALEHFEATYFAGLARVAFERGDKAPGLKWLQLMIDFTKPDRKQETAAAIASLPLIAKYSERSSSTEELAQLDPATTLPLAAEMAAEFGEFEVALEFRQQLLVESPDDEQNQIELVRLLGASGKTDEAIQRLADIISNRTLTRTTRWQAVWLAPELAAKNPSLWDKLRDRVRSLSPNDSEMSLALESLSQGSVKPLAEAENDAPNVYLSSLQAIIEKQAGNNGESLHSFTRALVEARESAAWKSFAFVEDEPLEQLVALYLKEHQPGAALKLAERVAAFQPNQNSAEQVTTGRYQTLHQRAEERGRASHVNLLELLSIAAEQLGDLNRAVELEQLRLALLTKQPDRDLAQARLNHLHELRTGAQPRKLSLVIDQRLVGAG